MPQLTKTMPSRRAKKSATSKASSAARGQVVAGISSHAVKAKTGKTWDQWCRLLDKAGAKNLPHKEIALIVAEHGAGNWWSQMVTVGYEQSRGLRKKHETSRGWQASASKTVNAPRSALYNAWDDPRIRREWLGDHDFTIRKKNAKKSMRITWPDGTDVEVNFYAKGPGKSQVAVQHGKLKGEAAVTKMKKTWRTALGRLPAVLEQRAT